jgi:hypothetical protein
MGQRNILLLIGTLAVLVVMAWLSGYFEGPASTVDTPALSLDSDQIRSITIRKGSDHVEVVKTDEGFWRLRSPVQAEVDTATKSALLNRLGDIEIENMISSRPDRYARFQVDSIQATYVRFETPEPLELYIGKSGPDFQSRYVRVGGDPNVYLANGVPTADATLDRWREKSLWSNPKESVSAATVATPESSYRLVREPGQWTVDHGDASSPADSAKVSRFLDRIATVRVDGFLTNLPVESVADSATHRLQVTFIDGSERSLTMQLRSSDVAAFEGRLEASSDVLKLYSYRAKNLAPEPTELLPDSSD